MNQSIYLQVGDSLVEMKEQPYDSESILQELLERYSHLLAGSQMDETNPRRWLFICREASIPHEQSSAGRLDHFFLDQEGIPTFVEVKRSTDTRIRREVVGQMLDYGANAVIYWPVDRIRTLFEESCAKRKVQPDEELLRVLHWESDYEKYWDGVKRNLQAGKIRMIFVADKIPSELKRIVEFLNSQMDRAEVLAVEVKRYHGQGQTTYVPRLIGQTSEAEARKRSETRQWDETTFFDELTKRHGIEQANVARQIFDWARPRMSRVWFGRGRNNGSFVPIYNHNGTDHQLFAVFTHGSVEIYFYWYTYKPPFDAKEKRLELLKRLNEIPGVKLPETAADRRPSIPLSLLSNKKSLSHFLQTFDWYLDEVNKS